MQTRVAIVLTVLCVAFAAQANESRRIDLIPRPQPTAGAAASDRKPVEIIEPIPRDVVEEVVREIAGSYNTPDLANFLGPQFFDSTRLTDTISAAVPRDARLQILGIQNVQTLDQYYQLDEAGEPVSKISVVSVTIRAQLVFNDPVAGFQSREGVNELVLDLEEELEEETEGETEQQG